MNFNESSRKSNTIRASAAGMIQQVAHILGSFAYRSIFLMILSKEYLGINGLFSNVLQLFSLAELGIGSAIQYSLYKPFAEKDTDMIGRLVHFYRKVYSLLAALVLLMGAAFYPFLGSIVDVSQVPSDVNLTLVYFLFVGQSAVSYLCVYKQSLLTADQRNHLISIYGAVLQLAGYVIKILLLLLTRNYVMVLCGDIVFSLTMNISFSMWITRQYRPVFDNKQTLPGREKKQIFTHTAGLLCHKIGQVVVTSTDNIILSKYVSLLAVGLYSNYAMIVSAVSNVVGRIMGGLLPSTTNYVLQKQKEETEELLYKILFLNLWFSCFTTVCLFLLLNPFIALWLDDTFLLSQAAVVCICMQYYLQTARLTINNFVNSCGLFYLDRVRPLIESAINLVVSIILAKCIGIAGVFVGTCVSGLLTYFWREPYLVYKHYFNKRTTRYWAMQFAWFGLMVVLCAALWWLINPLPDGIGGFISRMFIAAVIPNVVIMLVFHRTKAMKFCLTTVIGFVKKK